MKGLCGLDFKLSRTYIILIQKIPYRLIICVTQKNKIIQNLYLFLENYIYCIKAINPSTINEIPVHDKPYNVHIRVSLCIKQYYIWVQTSKPSAHSKNPHCFCLGSGQAKNFLPLLGPSFITVLNAAGLPWFGQIGNFSSAH